MDEAGLSLPRGGQQCGEPCAQGDARYSDRARKACILDPQRACAVCTERPDLVLFATKGVKPLVAFLGLHLREVAHAVKCLLG